MKKTVLLLLMTAAFAAPAFAQEDIVATNEALGFLRFERNPARVAMAGAGAASKIGGSAYAAFGNPAAAVRSPKKIEAGASYAKWAPDINSSTNIAAAASFKLGKAFAVSAGYSSQKFDELDLGESAYAPKDMVLAAGLSLSLGEFVSMGASVNYAKEQLLEDYSYTGLGADVILSYNKNSLGVAAGVRSLGGKVGDSSLPSYAMAAVAWSIPAGPAALSVAADADYYFSGNWSAAAGLEVSVVEVVQLRAGYRLSSEHAVLPSHLAFGAGLRLGPCTVDVAYLTASEYLGGTLTGGLTVAF